MAKEKILIVDDEEFFRQSLADFLSAEGYDLDVSASGQEALQKMAGQKYDLMILDLVMPGLSGLETLELAKEKDPEISVIIATGHGSVESAVTAMSKGAYYYVSKPIIEEEFRHIVRNSLEKRRLELENVSLRRELTLFEINKALASTLDLEKLMSLLLDSTIHACGAAGGYIIIKPMDDSEETSPRLSRGIKHLQESPQHPWDPELLKVFEDFSSYHLITDIKNKKEFSKLQKKYNLNSAIVVNLATQEDNFGQLVLLRYNRQPAFNQGELRMASLLATQGSVALKNALLYKDIQDLSVKDDQTSAYNRRFLDEFLDEEIERAERYNRSLSLIFLDMDHLKHINDNYGHLVGSAVLHETADLLTSLIRKVDKLIRYGGDEFLIILPETDLAGATKVAQRICLHIKKHVFQPRTDLQLQATASLGVAIYPQHGQSRDDLIRAADQAMYRVKETTRDGVAIAPGSKP